VFSLEAYSCVERTYSARNPPDPENPLKFSQVNIYKAAVKSVWQAQHAAKLNAYSWDNHINDGNMKSLMVAFGLECTVPPQ
jgi:hypothetical protein